MLTFRTPPDWTQTPEALAFCDQWREIAAEAERLQDEALARWIAATSNQTAN